MHALSRCHAWKTGNCDFSSVFSQSARSAMLSMYAPFTASPAWLEGASGMFRTIPASNERVVIMRRGVPEVQHDPDPCNRFLTCTTCIGQHAGQFQCGWCMGGTVVYNDTGDSGLKCAGFISGEPALPFTCPLDFRTSECSGKAIHMVIPWLAYHIQVILATTLAPSRFALPMMMAPILLKASVSRPARLPNFPVATSRQSSASLAQRYCSSFLIIS